MGNIQPYVWMLLNGFKLTVLVGVASMLLAIVLGLAGAWGKLARPIWARLLADVYTTIMRGVPELVIILLIYYGVPTLIQDVATRMGSDLVLNLNPFVSGIATIGIIYGAFSTEVFRGAYLAVPKGQIEAAQAMGMNRILTFRRVLLPQMWRFALPGLGNVWMVLIKATALISVIQLPELMRSADVAARATRLPFTFFFIASALYLLLTVASMWLQQRMERWANRGIRRA